MADLDENRAMPRWIWKATAIFWFGFVALTFGRFLIGRLSGLLLLLLVSLFLALAIEPGVNRMSAKGWRRGHATALILGAVLVATIIFVAAIGTLVGSQLADVLSDSERSVTKTVTAINDTFGTSIDAQGVVDRINDPEGAFQKFINSQANKAVELSVAALGFLLQMFSVTLFTFYIVADGPRLRRAICSRLRPAIQTRVLDAWELAINKTGGYLYSRALLAGLSAFFHWVVFQSLGTQAPIAMALWVGLVSQFLPVVGTYLAGALPVLLELIDSPLKAAVMFVFVALYQQVENYFLAPRITARTMELHPAIAFASALGGGAVLGPVGAVLALPAAAMVQALVGAWGDRHEVVDSTLTRLPVPTQRQQRRLDRIAGREFPRKKDEPTRGIRSVSQNNPIRP